MKYKIMGRYNRKIEVIDEAATRKEASLLVEEYTMAFGEDWCIWVKEPHKLRKLEEIEEINGKKEIQN